METQIELKTKKRRPKKQSDSKVELVPRVKETWAARDIIGLTSSILAVNVIV